MLGGMFAQLLPSAHALARKELDVCSEGAVARVFAEYRPSVVLNCAAYTDVDAAETHEEEAMRVNRDAVRLIARHARRSGARVVHFSTDYVFAGDRAEGYDEGDTPSPRNAYGRSKYAGEQALREETTDYLLVRTAWLYGPGGKNFVDTIAKKLESGEALSVVGDQEGSPTYTKDLAQAVLELLSRSARSGIYHVVNAGRTTWYGFAEEIRRILGSRSRLTEVTSDAFPRPATRPRYSVLNNTTSAPLPPWEDALRRYVGRRSMAHDEQ